MSYFGESDADSRGPWLEFSLFLRACLCTFSIHYAREIADLSLSRNLRAFRDTNVDCHPCPRFGESEAEPRKPCRKLFVCALISAPFQTTTLIRSQTCRCQKSFELPEIDIDLSIFGKSEAKSRGPCLNFTLYALISARLQPTTLIRSQTRRSRKSFELSEMDIDVVVRRMPVFGESEAGPIRRSPSSSSLSKTGLPPRLES